MKTKCKNLPAKYKGISLMQAMELFISDSKIPPFNSSGKQYSLRTNNKESRKVFSIILMDESIDFSILVSQTSKYYNSINTILPGLANFFIKGTWKEVYENYEEKSPEKDNTFWL